MTDLGAFEERITVWRAAQIDVATERAEQDARTSAGDIDARYMGLAQAYGPLYDASDDGLEVLSLIRDSGLEPDANVNAFFDKGNERTGDIGGP